MITIHPAVLAGWRRDGEATGLCLEVDDPAATWSALCESLDETVIASTVGSWSKAAVTSPAGLLFRCAAEDPATALDDLVGRLEGRGVTTGRLTLDPGGDDVQAAGITELAEQTSWITAWLVPVMVPGLSLTYRTVREWRIRRFPPGSLDKALEGVADTSVAGTARVVWEGGSFAIAASELPAYLKLWIDHGLTTTSIVGPPAGPTPVTAGATPVFVTSVRRGTELMGLGRAGVGLADDLEQACALLADLTELIVELSDVLAYAVVGVHETGRHASTGTPFREAAPATARAQSRGLSLAALDQWVLDAAPVQLLSPHHQVSRRDGIDEEPLPNGRRLVRIGTAADWFSGTTPRTLIRNRGREALAACLPPPRTPMPAPIL